MFILISFLLTYNFLPSNIVCLILFFFFFNYCFYSWNTNSGSILVPRDIKLSKTWFLFLEQSKTEDRHANKIKSCTYEMDTSKIPLLSVFCVLVMELSISSVALHHGPTMYTLWLSPSYRWGDWGLERPSHIIRVLALGSGKSMLRQKEKGLLSLDSARKTSRSRNLGAESWRMSRRLLGKHFYGWELK